MGLPYPSKTRADLARQSSRSGRRLRQSGCRVRDKAVRCWRQRIEPMPSCVHAGGRGDCPQPGRQGTVGTRCNDRGRQRAATGAGMGAGLLLVWRVAAITVVRATAVVGRSTPEQPHGPVPAGRSFREAAERSSSLRWKSCRATAIRLGQLSACVWYSSTPDRVARFPAPPAATPRREVMAAAAGRDGTGTQSIPRSPSTPASETRPRPNPHLSPNSTMRPMRTCETS